MLLPRRHLLASLRLLRDMLLPRRHPRASRLPPRDMLLPRRHPLASLRLLRDMLFPRRHLLASQRPLRDLLLMILLHRYALNTLLRFPLEPRQLIYLGRRWFPMFRGRQRKPLIPDIPTIHPTVADSRAVFHYPVQLHRFLWLRRFQSLLPFHLLIKHLPLLSCPLMVR